MLVLNFCYSSGFNAGKDRVGPGRHGGPGHGNDKRKTRMLGAITNWSTNLVERYLPVMGFCLIVSGVVISTGLLWA
jgi:hypothetical protein